MKREKWIRRGLTAALAAVFAVSVAMLGLQAWQNRVSEEADAEAAELVKLPELPELPQGSAVSRAPESAAPGEESPGVEEPPSATEPVPVQEDPYAQALREMDFAALQEVNPDVVGWLVIPETGISYPLLQGETNNTYLRHTWRGEYSTRGSVFIDSQCSRELTDFNTIVYGHRMRNGTMFAPLANYGSESYRQAHPCVYIATNNGTYRYEIFAVYETNTSASAYRLGMNSEAARQQFLDECRGVSALDTGLVPTPKDRILTLSTCTTANDDTRLVVQAVLWSEREEPETEPPAETETPGAPEPQEAGEPLLPPEALSTGEPVEALGGEEDGSLTE